MPNDVTFIDNSDEILNEFQSTAIRALEKCGLIAENYAKRNLTENGSVDTGRLRNSISHEVDDSGQAVYVGTNVEYAPYVELGTGKYTQGGRPTPWVYQDDNGNWHMTHGHKAQPYLKPAVADHTQTYRNIIDDEMRN